MYYAGLFVGRDGTLHLVKLEGITAESADDWADILLQSDDYDYEECIFILDTRDLLSLAQFFGKHRDEFSIELGG